MLPSTRVRVIKPPVNRPELQSLEGRVLTLIDEACDPLRYKIAIKTNNNNGDSNNTIVELPSTSVSMLDYEDDEGEMDDMIHVNNLCYCSKHRLENCGECCYGFRVGNLISELAGNDAVDIGVRLDEELSAIGFRARRAPNKNLEPLPFDLYTPVINDAIISVPSGLNVIGLDDFPRDKSFVNTFEGQFLINIQTGQFEEPSEKPLYCVRKKFTNIGSYLDTAIREKKALPRLFLQDEAQSVVLNMEIVAIKILVCEYLPGVKWRMPIIVVAWSKFTAGNRIAMDASLRALQPGTPMVEIPATTQEIELFARLIEANAGQVSVESLQYLKLLVAKMDADIKPTRQIGIIAPIRTSAQDNYYKLLGEYCDYCTASQCKLMKCSRCKEVSYCTRACQKIEWKKHKQKCTVYKLSAIPPTPHKLSTIPPTPHKLSTIPPTPHTRDGLFSRRRVRMIVFPMAVAVVGIIVGKILTQK